MVSHIQEYPVGKEQRIRDPLHDLIAFQGKGVDRLLWQLIQTPEFQRLRRVKQLGFSDFVYPGATHTRFAHSLGALHLARRLLCVIRERNPDGRIDTHREDLVCMAALLHDVGHGPFSHAFEEATKELGKRYDHEIVGARLIQQGAIAKILGDDAARVAGMLTKQGQSDIYNAVISSQFDADRLDYMMRDRMMTGTRLGLVDLDWLLANLDVCDVSVSFEDEKRSKRTFVLARKAYHAAESYVLNLFHLYPTVYFHKATRGMEKFFSALFVKTVRLIQDGGLAKTGLPANHPLVRLAEDPGCREHTPLLDDTTIWGAISLMEEAKEPLLSEFSQRLLNRRLYKCFDVREMIRQKFLNAGLVAAAHGEGAGDSADDRLERAVKRIEDKLGVFLRENGEKGDKAPFALLDQGERVPYKVAEEEGSLNQIMIMASERRAMDLREVSPLVKGLRAFSFFRLYLNLDHDKGRKLERYLEESIAEQEAQFRE